MSAAPIRVLVVDDSAFARKVMREVLERHADFTVVGTARDGLDALEKITQLSPDVITLDLVMPDLDGLGLLRHLAQQAHPPRVVLVSMSSADSEMVVEALSLGAMEVVHKPTALATDRLYELGSELRDKVRSAFAARPVSVPHPQPIEPAGAVAEGSAPLVVVGTSTGGPHALGVLLSALPEDFPSPVAIALHIPPGYTEALAKRLDGESRLEVLEARDGLPLVPGRAVIARAGIHLKVAVVGGQRVCRLDVLPMGTPHTPSVDVLFESAAEALGSQVIGVVLTGMGEDGLAGSRRLHQAGARLVTQSEASCVVYGMPRSVVEAGLSPRSASLEEVPRLLTTLVRRARDGS